MPDMETQTEDFIILDKDQVKKLSIPDRKQYKIELKEYRHEQSIIRHREYCRNYQRTWNKMKYKYDPAFKQRHNENMKKYVEKKKLKKELLKNTNEPQKQQDNEGDLLISLGLLTI